MFNSYHQLELRRKNIWHEGCHKTLANFKSVAYVHNRCRSESSLVGRPPGPWGHAVNGIKPAVQTFRPCLIRDIVAADVKSSAADPKTLPPNP